MSGAHTRTDEVRDSARRSKPATHVRAYVGVGLVVLLAILWTVRAQEVPFFGDVLVLLSTVSVAAALVGNWLVLRRVAMMSDAIAHAILFGIVVMLFVMTRYLGMGLDDLASPLFVVGAAMAGLLTVFLTESLVRTGLVREDASIGMVFAFLFAMALVIISLLFRDAHVDEHLVLAGGVEITVLRQLVVRDITVPGPIASTIGGVIQTVAPPDAVTVTQDGVMTIDGWRLGPRALWTMGAILLANLSFVGLLWKELKLTTFDAGLAASLGFAPVALNYALMGLVSVTAVGAFEAVGSIIVIALFIVPPATAYLLTDDLAEMTVLSVVLALLAALLGFTLGAAVNANFGGSVATVSGVLFAGALLLAPRQGLATQVMRRRTRRRAFAVDTLLVHVAHHQATAEADEETAVDRLPHHLRWSPEYAAAIVRRAVARGFAVRAEGHLVLTTSGMARAAQAIERVSGGEPVTSPGPPRRTAP